MITEQEMQDLLQALLEGTALDPGIQGDLGVETFSDLEVSTFEEDGVLTENKGLNVVLADESEFQLTIVQVHSGRDMA